jgi:hypothetical protein
MSDPGVDVIIQAEKLGPRNPPDLVFESRQNTLRPREKASSQRRHAKLRH